MKKIFFSLCLFFSLCFLLPHMSPSPSSQWGCGDTFWTVTFWWGSQAWGPPAPGLLELSRVREREGTPIIQMPMVFQISFHVSVSGEKQLSLSFSILSLICGLLTWSFEEKLITVFPSWARCVSFPSHFSVSSLCSPPRADLRPGSLRRAATLKGQRGQELCSPLSCFLGNLWTSPCQLSLWNFHFCHHVFSFWGSILLTEWSSENASSTFLWV